MRRTKRIGVKSTGVAGAGWLRATACGYFQYLLGRQTLNSTIQVDSSIQGMWDSYLAHCSEPTATLPPAGWYFCDNELDADTCAALVLAGRKRATAPSLWFLESRGQKLPVVGELDIVTNWRGIAQCIIRTTAVRIVRSTAVRIVRFREVTAEHAMAEGEGDGSLAFWRATHREYYKRELAGTAHAPAEDMLVVLQHFELVYP